MTAEFLQRIGIEDLDVFATQGDPTLLLDASQQSADHLAHASKLVGEMLMRCAHWAAESKQERSETLIQSAKGNFLDDLHQIGHALGKQMKHEFTKDWLLGDQSIEEIAGHRERREILFYNAGR